MTEERKPRRRWIHPQLYLGITVGLFMSIIIEAIDAHIFPGGN